MHTLTDSIRNLNFINTSISIMKQKTIDTLRWIALPFWIIIGFFLINWLAPFVIKFFFYMSWWSIDNWFYYGIESMITGALIAPSIAIVTDWIAPSNKGTTTIYSSLIISSLFFLMLLIFLVFNIGMWWEIQHLNYIWEVSMHPIFDGIAATATLIIKMIFTIVGMIWVHKNTNRYN